MSKAGSLNSCCTCLGLILSLVQILTKAMFTPYRISFCAGTQLEQVAHTQQTSTTSCWSDWSFKFGEIIRIPIMSVCVLLIHFRHCLNTCSHSTKVWYRTHPICDTPVSRLARRSLAPLQKWRQNHSVITCEQNPYPVWFSRRCNREEKCDVTLPW